MSSLKSIVAHIPHAPGVYRFLNVRSEVIYVGKAKDLKKRVSSYFRNEKNRALRLLKLVEHTADVQYTVVDSELEALILETNLIKSLRPKYNILMKDDKNYVYLKITVEETYPRILIVRKVDNDGARYFGPRTSAAELRRVLDALKKLFPYRHCQRFIQLKEKKALNVSDHRKRCFGTCVFSVEPDVYRRAIDQMICFFEGKTEALESSIKKEMNEAVAHRAFERAALLRDRLQTIESFLTTQRVSVPDALSRDVVGVAVDGGSAYVTLFAFRDGKLIQQENFVLGAVDASGAELDEEEVLVAFIPQYYEKVNDVPKEILIPTTLSDRALFQEWIRSMTGHAVILRSPKRGKNRAFLDLARDNARSFARQSQVKWQAGAGQDVEAALVALKELFHLPRIPKRIECYDISHLGGTDTVGSMVVFDKGFPSSADYRHFKLRTVQEKIDDFQAMKEVLTRRFRYLKTLPSFLRKPKKSELEGIRKILENEKLDTENLDQHRMLVVEKSKKIVGFARLRLMEEGIFELASLWVDPKFRGQNLGDELTHALLKKVKKGKIYTLPCAHLMDWYAAMGFHLVKEIPNVLLPKLKHCQDVFGDGVGKYMVYRAKAAQTDGSFSKKPDLLVIDGGKGQLKEAMKALDAAHLKIPVVSLAKRIEEIFVPGRARSLVLPHESGELQLLQRLRDEAHRFALAYQRDLRGKRMMR